MNMGPIVTIDQAVTMLRASGMTRMTNERLRRGMEQGVYKIGDVLQGDKEKIYDVYPAMLYRFMEERDSDNVPWEFLNSIPAKVPR